MTAPTEIEFKVTADTSQAQAAVAGLEGEFKKSTSAAAMLDKRIEALTADMDSLSTAIVKGDGNVEAYRAELQRLERQMDALEGVTHKTASSVDDFSVGMQKAGKANVNIGETALGASRALEDLQYGFAGIVNNLPQLIGGLGGGAGVVAAVSLIGITVNQVIKNWDSFAPAVDDATKKSRDYVKGFDKDLKNLATTLDSITGRRDKQQEHLVGSLTGITDKDALAIRIVRAEADGLEAELRALNQLTQREGLFASWVEPKNITLAREKLVELRKELKTLESAQKTITPDWAGGLDDPKVAEAKRKAEEANRKKEEAAERAAERARLKLERAAQKEIADEAKRNDDAERAAYQDQQKMDAIEARARASEDAEIKRQELADEKEARRIERDREKRARDDEREQDRLDAAAKRLADRNRRRQSTIEGVNVADRFAFSSLKSTDPEVARIDALTDHEFDALKLRRDRWADFYGDIGGLASSMFDGLISETANLFNALAAGEEKAVESFAVNVMKNAGQSLVASGTKLAGEAVVSALTPGLQPLAAAQLAGAVGLVGAGVGLGASAGALGNILGLNKESAASSRDPGASPRSLGDGGGSGLIVNVSYGVAGPLPEDTAREVQAALAVEGRR